MKKNSCLAMRLYLFAHRHPKLGKVICKLNRVLNSCDIPRSADIDETVVFFHNGLGCVIHESAVIGANTAIFQNVTIGGRGRSGCPTIGKNVFIGAGAVILGGVLIGDNARIGANAVVLCDVPENCTAVGVPAEVIKSDQNHIVNPLTVVDR